MQEREGGLAPELEVSAGLTASLSSQGRDHNFTLALQPCLLGKGGYAVARLVVEDGVRAANHASHRVVPLRIQWLSAELPCARAVAACGTRGADWKGGPPAEVDRELTVVPRSEV